MNKDAPSPRLGWDTKKKSSRSQLGENRGQANLPWEGIILGRGGMMKWYAGMTQEWGVCVFL